MSYEAAKITVQSYGGVTSRKKYERWHDRVGPYFIPKTPHRVYPEWTSWNDFLGTDNSFDGWDRKAGLSQSWMPYWEAVRYVQKLGLQSQFEYKDAYERGEIDKTIPKAPNVTYGDQWTGWISFLGKDIRSKMQSVEQVTGILCLCTNSLLPSNVLEVIIAQEGLGQMKSKLEAKPELRAVRAYVWESELWPQVQQVLSACGSEQEKGQFLFPNVNQVVYELDNILLIYKQG